MLRMFFLILGIKQDIIDEYHHELIQVFMEYTIHQIHEYSWSIRQTKQHHHKLEMPVPGSKCRLRYIIVGNSQLI